jgi:ribosomal protein S18 acetylase RimI-like enzyme
MVVSIRNITLENSKDLDRFLNNAGESLKTFRYFSSRPVSVLSNHLTTVLLYEDNDPIGYGHLDKDGETTWLGICIQHDKKNNGYGKQVMNKLIRDAIDKKIPFIKLTVDEVNSGAIKLYETFGFKSSGEIKPGVLLMTLAI